MSYVLFIVASTADYFGTFAVMFTLFRFQINRDFFVKVFFIALLMSQVSYFTRLVPEIGALSTFIQYFLFVGIVWYLFNVPLKYSFVVNFAGLAIAFVVPILCVLAVTASGGPTLSEIQASSVLPAAFQFLSAVIQIGIARTIYIRNWGFDFVPTDRRTYTPLNKTNAIIVSIIAFSIVLSAAVSTIFRNNFENYMIYSGAVFLITLPIFLYFSLRKDVEDAE